LVLGKEDKFRAIQTDAVRLNLGGSHCIGHLTDVGGEFDLDPIPGERWKVD
jgi:hypothetical protein